MRLSLKLIGLGESMFGARHAAGAGAICEMDH